MTLTTFLRSAHRSFRGLAAAGALALTLEACGKPTEPGCETTNCEQNPASCRGCGLDTKFYLDYAALSDSTVKHGENFDALVSTDEVPAASTEGGLAGADSLDIEYFDQSGSLTRKVALRNPHPDSTYQRTFTADNPTQGTTQNDRVRFTLYVKPGNSSTRQVDQKEITLQVAGPSAPPPTAQDVNATFSEADSAAVATVTTGDPARTISTAAVPANIEAVVIGSQIRVKGKTNAGVNWDDVNGTYNFLYIVTNPDGQADTANVSGTIAAQPDLRIATIDRIDGQPLSQFDIIVNGQRYSVNGQRSIQVAPGALTLGVDLAQVNIHQFQHYILGDGQRVVLDRNRLSYGINIGSGDLSVDLGGLEVSRHPEFQGASYQVFRIQWPTINPPIAMDRSVVYTGGSNGGGIFGCDEFDMSAAHIAAARVASDSLKKYVLPIWPSVQFVEQYATPAFVTPFGVRLPVDGEQIYCPGSVGNVSFIRNGLPVAALARDRDELASVSFIEMAGHWWGRPDDIESPGNQGISMFEENATYLFPRTLDIGVWKLIPLAVDGNRQDKKGLTF